MSAGRNWFEKDATDFHETDRFLQSTLEYPGLSKARIFESVERVYHCYSLRPKPILCIIMTMWENKVPCVRRMSEGYKWFKSMAQRRNDREAARVAS